MKHGKSSSASKRTRSCRPSSKIFSGSSTAFGAEPNVQANAVDIALPGVLPVLNKGAVECAIRFGLAVGAQRSPAIGLCAQELLLPGSAQGLPDQPVRTAGGAWRQAGDSGGEIMTKTVHLTRAHLEEDAGKSLHEGSGPTFHGQVGNRPQPRRNPLLEIVTEPDMRSSAEAVAYARALHALVRWIGICDGNMQEGSFRCDANVSVRPSARPQFGTRREIKNLNSFRFMQQAIDYEVQWQIATLEDGGRSSRRPCSSIRDGETRAMRSKEDAHDYRYFPDPDLLPLSSIGSGSTQIRSAMPELPAANGASACSPTTDSRLTTPSVLTSSLELADYYEAAVAAAGRRTPRSAPTG
jgi:aspartyl-tRNA(Asn)/glutamyl-tRNA(Gln) amidotransferase subunit B